MRTPDNRLARKTTVFPWAKPLPFTSGVNAFTVGNLGALCNSGGTSAPTAATQRLMVSSGTVKISANQDNAGDLSPITNPTNFATGNYWYEEIPEADIILIRPYLIQYDTMPPGAYASAAAAQGITCDLSFFLIKPATLELGGKPLEYVAELKGRVTVSNAANRINSSTKQLPIGAQWCDAKTVVTDYTIDPGIVSDGEVAGGALRLRFDQEGALGLLTYVSDLTTNAGAGWLRSHL